MDFKEILIKGCSLYGIHLSDTQIDQFRKYRELLAEWNEKMNLTGITEEIEVAKKHFIDSVSIIKSGKLKENIRLIDVGTGAGFPGMVVKIIRPDIQVVLLDSLNKRINFLNTVINELGLKNIETVHGRAEDFGRKEGFRENFDIATARAVANLTVLSEYCMPYVKQGGYFIALKGPSANEEVIDAKNAIGTLGGKLIGVMDTEIPEEDMQHKIVVVEKINKISEKYPRKAGQIEKKPIK
ncbi:16S rRNA methyltransferase [Fervidicella metallireducens AeB]|uniref:Ribosomal RNA small subunit methyltransferase G n=1 Tax=Fervidicella metallireducens AeB TaxID=1403537 RepID=A0A017RVE6_9CLOT|nr:16S rRNA (guanine(527)-N(7))-methyltransferase RsmG [Fervidicella metallireducens]EYE88647.1 16S rRNA methyltransferase [Fervidicella metallireducens AeB]